MEEEMALEQVRKGEAHLALVTGEVSSGKNLSVKVLEQADFHTYIGRGHPLYADAQQKKIIPVGTVLQHDFVSPHGGLLGKVGAKQSLDGWRDDQFPRKITFTAASLKILENIVVKGKAIAYLPDYFCEDLDLAVLKISGCPYFCRQKIKLVARNPKEVSWINQIF